MYPSPDLMSGRERSMQGACWTWAMINLVYVWMCACVRMLEKEEKRRQESKGSVGILS